ncbi:MAG: protein-disulfide reductase DsbD family protein [Limisphaerales bacterium]
MAALLCLAGMPAQAAHTQARLVLAAETARPGDTVLAGIVLQMEPRWHTYWRNPGASGIPTTVEWQLPWGVTPGPLQWPAPEKLPDDDLTTYIYRGEVVLLAPLKLAASLPRGPLVLKAKVSWLECEAACIPGSAAVQAALSLGPQTAPSKEAGLLESWQGKLPKPAAALAARAGWEKPPTGDLRALIMEWNSAGEAGEADFYPDASEQFEVQPATERIPADAGKVRLRKQVKKISGDWPEQISGVLVQGSGSQRLAWEGTLPVAATPPPGPAAQGSGGQSASRAVPASSALAPSLWKMLLYAFIGGLILNVMPCVLPVIALKVLGFVGQGREEPRGVRALGLIYGLGVLFSFLLLAGLVISVQAAGHKAGWGMQFGSPQFLAGLTTLVTLIALNLFGLFEVNLGGRVLGAAGGLAAKHGPAGAFFNGVLATVLATPCTAPFLGAALGFAFTQPPPVIVLVFLTVGVGLAAPYVVLAWNPGWLRFLPKPGPWMERFKVAMGFPMLATAIWLFSLLPAYYGPRSWWLLIFLVLVAMAAWVYGQFVQRGSARRGLALASALVLLAGGYYYVIEGQLQWRFPVAETVAEGSLKEGPGGIDWQRWSPAALTQARAAGHPAIVDFTADWCLTCQANKKFALEVTSVREKLRQVQASAFLGDYTRLPANITLELNRYGRAGVPLVLVYPKDPQAPPIVLPEALTPGIVLAALDRAAR